MAGGLSQKWPYEYIDKEVKPDIILPNLELNK